jgi:hypothetical protein
VTDPEQTPTPEPDETVRVTREDVVVRRSPRVWRILALGAGLGAVAAFVTTFALPETPGFEKGQIFGFSLLLFVVLFGALAALLVILLERVVGRRTRTVTAERVSVGEEPAEPAKSVEPAKPAEATDPDAPQQPTP